MRNGSRRGRTILQEIRLSSLVGYVLFAVVLAGCSRGEVTSVELDPGDTQKVTTVAHCGFTTLEITVNGQAWSSDELPVTAASNPVEPAWQPSGEAGYELELTLIDKQTLSVTVSGSGVSHIYMPEPNPPGCA